MTPAKTQPTVASTEALVVFLKVMGKRVEVGRLAEADGNYQFTYAAEFRKRKDLPPIPDFPDKDRVYLREDLWPFFELRVPPINRADVSQRLQRERVRPTDHKFAILAAVGRRSASNPYELEPTAV